MRVINFETKAENPFFEGVFDIEPHEVFKLHADLHIIDVREQEEWISELGHFEKAKLIKLSLIPEHLDQMPKDRVIVFICRSGKRSAQAASFVLDNGFKTVYNMKGGMLLWNEHNLPTKKTLDT